jgi:hypothetical protein
MTTARSTVFLFTLVISIVLNHSLSIVLADEPVVLPFPVVGFQAGVIEEIHGSSIRIDGRTYVLKADVLVIDHKGRPLEVDRIIPSSLAKFHMKEGHIDKMMVTLPQ